MLDLMSIQIILTNTIPVFCKFRNSINCILMDSHFSNMWDSQNFRPRTSMIFVNTKINLKVNQRDIFQHVPITSRKPVKPDSKGVPGFFAFWGSSRILANPGAS